jgi:hypothetical protein
VPRRWPYCHPAALASLCLALQVESDLWSALPLQARWRSGCQCIIICAAAVIPCFWTPALRGRGWQVLKRVKGAAHVPLVVPVACRMLSVGNQPETQADRAPPRPVGYHCWIGNAALAHLILLLRRMTMNSTISKHSTSFFRRYQFHACYWHVWPCGCCVA